MAKKKQVRMLSDIETNEVSIVGEPANKKKFLFFKQKGKPNVSSLSKQKTKVNIEIESDGSAKGTKIIINGDTLDKVKSFDFSFYDVEKGTTVHCSYSRLVESEGGFKRTETFYLSKGNKKMDEKMLALLKTYLGEEEVNIEKQEKPVEVITEALKVVDIYKGDFPEDLTKAVADLAIHAALSTVPVKKDEEKPAGEETTTEEEEEETTTEEETPGEEKKEVVKSIIESLQKLLPDKKLSKTDKTLVGIQKTLADLTKKMKKSSDTEESKSLKETLEEISKRLETVEKSKGMKKSVKGQEDTNDGGEEQSAKWPSLTGKKTED